MDNVEKEDSVAVPTRSGGYGRGRRGASRGLNENREVYNSNLTDIFQGSSVDDALDAMFAQIKQHVEHPVLPASGFTIDRMMHLDVNFYKLQVTKGSCYMCKSLSQVGGAAAFLDGVIVDVHNCSYPG